VGFPARGRKIVVKRVHVVLDDDEYDRLTDAKGDRTWKDVLKDGIEQ
jgi:hypothetical protein